MGDIFLYLVVVVGVMCGFHLSTHDGIKTLLVGVVGIVCSVAFYVGAMMFAASSTEVWNGEVTSKDVSYDPYSESYTCGTDSKGNSITCTRLVPRWRWDVNSNVGTWSKHTSSALLAPKIYKNAKIGEPFAATKRFMNYQYVSDQTIHVNKQDVYDGWLPEYPELYRGYQINHALSNVVNTNNLDAMLAWAHKSWGPKYGINVTVCVVSDTASGFSNALRNKWVGGKKNDAVVTLYVDSAETVKNVEVFSRSTKTKRDEMQADFETVLRESVAGVGTYDFEGIVNAIEKALPLFEREDLSQYDYLSTDYESPFWVKVLGAFIVFAACFGFATWLGRYSRNSYMYKRHNRRH